MTALAVAGILGGGFVDSLGQLARSPWALVPAAVAALMLAASWRLRRGSRTMRPVIPPAAEVGDDTLAMLAQHREHDDDTFLADGLTAELERLLKGDGRDG